MSWDGCTDLGVLSFILHLGFAALKSFLLCLTPTSFVLSDTAPSIRQFSCDLTSKPLLTISFCLPLIYQSPWYLFLNIRVLFCSAANKSTNVSTPSMAPNTSQIHSGCRVVSVSVSTPDTLLPSGRNISSQRHPGEQIAERGRLLMSTK